MNTVGNVIGTIVVLLAAVTGIKLLVIVGWERRDRDRKSD